MKRLLLQIFAWLAILVGAGLMLQPTVSQYLTRRKSTAAVETFVQSAAESAAVAADDSAAENTRPYADLYDALQAYNAEIYAAGQSGLKDPFAYETPAFDLTAYGLPDDMIAALWVPRLDLDLPVYLGASTENMAQIQIGDKITLTTPWETLTYRVCELKIIQPDDINAILIQPGRDLLTLTTCHPYTQNTQRYLVIAERDPDAAPATHEEDLAECAGSWDAAPRQVTVESPDGTAAVEEIAPESISPLPNEGSGEDAGGAYSNWMIWLENNALWAGIVLIAAVVGCGLILRRHRKD